MNTAIAHDHVRKFLDELCVQGTGCHVQISAMLKAYGLWCGANKIVNRRHEPVPFLAILETEHGIVAGRCTFIVDGEERCVYALQNVRFKHDVFNKLKQAGAVDAAEAHITLSGRGRRGRDDDDDDPPPKPKVVREPREKRVPMTPEEMKAQRKQYYERNKAAIMARKRERLAQKEH